MAASSVEVYKYFHHFFHDCFASKLCSFHCECVGDCGEIGDIGITPNNIHGGVIRFCSRALCNFTPEQGAIWERVKGRISSPFVSLLHDNGVNVYRHYICSPAEQNNDIISTVHLSYPVVLMINSTVCHII